MTKSPLARRFRFAQFVVPALLTLAVLTPGHGQSVTNAPSATPPAKPKATSSSPSTTATKAPASRQASASTSKVTTKTTTQDKAIQLPDVVVTAATRVAQAPDTTATSSTVVTQKQIIDLRDVSVPDALMQVPGLSIVPSGAPGQPTSVFIRGNDSNMTLLTIDGRRQPSNILGGQDFSNLTLDNIAQVEVVRTPSSSMQGGNSAGGIINLVSQTGRGLETPVTSATFEGGSYDYFRGQLQSMGAYKDFDWAVSGSELTNNNNRPNENQRNTVYRGNFGYQVNQQVYVDVHSGYSLSNVGAPNVIQTPNPLERVQSEDWFISPEVVANVTDFYTSKLYFNYDQQTLTDNNPYTDFLNNFASHSVTTIDSEEVDWQNNFQIAKNWQLTAGVQMQNSVVDYNSTYVLFGTTAFNNSNLNMAGYVESQWQPIQGLNVLSSIREDQYSDYDGHLSWRQGVAYNVPQTGTQLHASGSSAYTPPSPGLLYFPGSANPNLKPETTLGWEAGVAQPLLNNKVTPGLTYFHNNITNYVESFAPTFIPMNIGHATTSGVEANLDVKPLDNLTLNLNYTYLNAVDDTTQQRLLRRPRNTFNFTAIYQPIEPVTLSLGGSWIVDRQDTYYDPTTFTSTRLTMPDYFTLRASASWKINKYVTVWTRGENITNASYQPVAGYPALGAAVYGGLKLTY